MSEEYVPVVFENRRDAAHLLSVTVASDSDHSGYTSYFNEARQLDSGEERTYEDDDGLTIGDSSPDVVALATLDTEAVARSDFSLRPSLEEVRIVVSKDGSVEIHEQT
ncbi:hypothetical protein ACLI4Z_08770 [Natrialbaceae archaeon A-arb3/5]